ncbi:MAG: 16S rRNA (cytidine(1402)-2'-O)-methyltransferase [Pseudomonadota bacterium]|jgi:16S rRNA (cytidine1402-2'-O)-methyltransferase
MDEESQDRAPVDITPALYVVATPLGNLSDITLRALAVLRGVDVIAAEDTRHTRRLLERYGIDAELLAAHEHNEAAVAGKLVQRVRQGGSVALVTDAGTPAVSDPGARIVAAMQAQGLSVIPVPGPSAAVAALSASGLTDEHFLFYGFLPPRPAARRAAIAGLRPLACALVFYEAPHRIRETVADLAAGLEARREIVIARELTKVYESIVRLPLGQAPTWLDEDANRRRGEFVLVVSGPPQRVGLDAEAERVLALLLAELPVKQAVKLAAEITGAARNELYQRALERAKEQ